MVDAEAVRRRLREVGRRLAALREVALHGEERFLSDAGLQAQAERHLQLAIQAAIDVALHLVAEETDAAPEEYGLAFESLGRLGVLDAGLAGRLRLAAGLRNVLVHAYLDVDPRRIWRHMGEVGDLEAFAGAVEEHLAARP